MLDAASSMEVLLRFWKFPDWRVAEINGERCLILPMDINGIDLSSNGDLPFMRMLVAHPREMTEKNGFVRLLRLTMPRRILARLVESGRAEPDEEPNTPFVGGIRPLLWASSFNRDLGTTFDKKYGLKLVVKKKDDKQEQPKQDRPPGV